MTLLAAALDPLAFEDRVSLIRADGALDDA
jgi:hypothetical protein